MKWSRAYFTGVWVKALYFLYKQEHTDCRIYCCCGDLIEYHGMGSGHSPVSMHGYYCRVTP